MTIPWQFTAHKQTKSNQTVDEPWIKIVGDVAENFSGGNFMKLEKSDLQIQTRDRHYLD